MNFDEIHRKVVQVSDDYTKEIWIERTPDWYMLKLQEELWELTQAYLGKGIEKDKKWLSSQQSRDQFEAELADVFWHIILLAHSENVNIEAALQKKWFKYLK